MKYACLFFIFFCLQSCYSNEEKLYKIDPGNINENKILLSEIANDITYIPLDNSIPFTYYKYSITVNYIYISAKGIGVLKYDRNGRLVNKIGNNGRGPGQFSLGMEFSVDENSGNVYILDPRKIIVYSGSGRFVRDISYVDYFNSHSTPADIEIYNSLLFLPDGLMEGNSKFAWVFLDTLGNPVSKKLNSVPAFNNTARPGSIYQFENKIFYFNYFNDTIFSISPDLSDKGLYLFAQGDFRWPRSRLETTSPEKFYTQLSNIFQPVKMFETSNFIIIRYYYQGNAITSLIDKETKKIFTVHNYDEEQGIRVKSGSGIINDLDGGLSLWLINYYSENSDEYFTTLINPFDLKVHIASDEFKKSNPLHPEKKKELERLANSLKETDNPVLVLVSLKK